jgi:hypothetical protein
MIFSRTKEQFLNQLIKSIIVKGKFAMRINKFIAIAVVLFGLLVGGLGAGVLLSQRPSSVEAAPPAQQDTTCVDDEDGENEAEGADDDANDACDDD